MCKHVSKQPSSGKEAGDRLSTRLSPLPVELDVVVLLRGQQRRGAQEARVPQVRLRRIVLGDHSLLEGGDHCIRLPMIATKA